MVRKEGCTAGAAHLGRHLGMPGLPAGLLASTVIMMNHNPYQSEIAS